MLTTYLLCWVAIGLLVLVSCLYKEYRTEGEVSVKLSELPLVFITVVFWPIVFIVYTLHILEEYKDIKLFELKKVNK